MIKSGCAFLSIILSVLSSAYANSIFEDGFEPLETVTPTSVTLNFFVDDSANQTYEAADGLAYRGSFSFDSTTRNLVFDGAFNGPYPLLFDDGPLSGGGNEPEGAVAGDNVWSATAFVDTSAAVALGYFAIRGSDGNSDGQFIWDRPNGIVNLTEGQTGTVNAAGLIIPAFGDQDMLVTVDVSGNGANLSELFRDVDYTDAVRIRLNALSGPLLEDSLVMRDDGTGGDAVANDGIYSFLLSENFGKHDGLLVTGSTVRFVLELAGSFYIAGDSAQSAGVTLAFNAVPAGFVANGDRLETTVP